MSSIEEKLDVEGKLPPYYRRYVDDTLTVMPDLPTARDFLNTLNDAHPAIKFTIRVENDRMLPFLGIQLLHRAPWYKRGLLSTMLNRAYRPSSSCCYFTEECE